MLFSVDCIFGFILRTHASTRTSLPNGKPCAVDHACNFFRCYRSYNFRLSHSLSTYSESRFNPDFLFPRLTWSFDRPSYSIIQPVWILLTSPLIQGIPIAVIEYLFISIRQTVVLLLLHCQFWRYFLKCVSLSDQDSRLSHFVLDLSMLQNPEEHYHACTDCLGRGCWQRSLGALNPFGRLWTQGLHPLFSFVQQETVAEGTPISISNLLYCFRPLQFAWRWSQNKRDSLSQLWVVNCHIREFLALAMVGPVCSVLLLPRLGFESLLTSDWDETWLGETVHDYRPGQFQMTLLPSLIVFGWISSTTRGLVLLALPASCIPIISEKCCLFWLTLVSPTFPETWSTQHFASISFV